MSLRSLALTLSLLALTAPPAAAASGDTATTAGPVALVRAPDRAAGFDLEVDPLAYVLGGHSLHAGFGRDRARLDLGAFGLSVPVAFHGHHGVDVHMSGFGLKADLFWRRDRTGGFAGVEAGLLTFHARAEASDLAHRWTQLNVGARVGWLFELGGGLYASPWVGVDRAFGADDFRLGDRDVRGTPWSVFPTVHLGYRLP